METHLSIVKVSKRDCPYVQIDHRPLNDRRLSWKARGLLAYLLSKPSDWEVIIAALVKESPGGEETVRGALKELEQVGYAKLETMRCDKGRVSGKRWIILELPESTDMAINPTSGFTSSGESGTTKKDVVQKKDIVKREAFEIPLLLNMPDFLVAWEKWITYLKGRRMTPSINIIEMHLKTLEGYGLDGALAAIAHSIESQYRKPYPPPRAKFSTGTGKPAMPVADYTNGAGFGETRQV